MDFVFKMVDIAFKMPNFALKGGDGLAYLKRESRLAYLTCESGKSGKKLKKSQVRLMVRIQLQIENINAEKVTDEWIDSLFDRYDTDQSGLMNDEEWDIMAPQLIDEVVNAFPHLEPKPEPEHLPRQTQTKTARTGAGSEEEDEELAEGDRSSGTMFELRLAGGGHNSTVESRARAWESEHDRESARLQKVAETTARLQKAAAQTATNEAAMARVATAELAHLRRVPICQWNGATVSEWLRLIGQQRYVGHWKRHCVDGAALIAFQKQPSTEWPWKLLEQLGVRPMAHRGAIVDELSQVTGWGGSGPGDASEINSEGQAWAARPQRQQPQEQAMVDERELKRLRMRVEREALAAEKAAKAEAASAAKLREAKAALTQYERRESLGDDEERSFSFSSLGDRDQQESTLDLAPTVNVMISDRKAVLRISSPARQKASAAKARSQQIVQSSPTDGGEVWMRKLDGVPSTAEPNYARPRSRPEEGNAVHAYVPATRSRSRSPAPVAKARASLVDMDRASPEHGDRFQAYGGKLDEEDECTFTPATNPTSAKIARNTPNLATRFDQRQVVARKKSSTTEEIECTFAPKLNANATSGQDHGGAEGPRGAKPKFKERMQEDLAKREEGKKRRGQHSHYVSGDEHMGIEHGGINRGFRGKSPGPQMKRDDQEDRPRSNLNRGSGSGSGQGDRPTSQRTHQSIEKYATRLLTARSPPSPSRSNGPRLGQQLVDESGGSAVTAAILEAGSGSGNGYGPRDIEQHSPRDDEQQHSGQQQRHRDVFRYRDAFDAHGNAHSGSSDEEHQEDARGDDRFGCCDEQRDVNAREVNRSAAAVSSLQPAVLRLASTETGRSIAQWTPERAASMLVDEPSNTAADAEADAEAELSVIEPVRGRSAAGALAAATPAVAGGGQGKGKGLVAGKSKWGGVRKKVGLTPVLSVEDWDDKSSALAQAIAVIEDAIDDEPDNMQLLTDLTHLHQEHVKAVNAAASAKMANIATAALNMAKGAGEGAAAGGGKDMGSSSPAVDAAGNSSSKSSSKSIFSRKGKKGKGGEMEAETF